MASALEKRFGALVKHFWPGAPQGWEGMKVESGLESYFLFALRAFAPEIPLPRTQAKLVPGRHFRFDFAWDGGLIVEINGGTWLARSGHSGGASTDKDYWRVNLAVAEGYRVMMFSSSMLRRDPRQCVELVKRALRTGPTTSV